MVNPEDVKAGAVIRSLDGGALLKISGIDATHAYGANPDGTKPRKVKLAALASRSVRGWVLETPAP